MQEADLNAQMDIEGAELARCLASVSDGFGSLDSGSHHRVFITSTSMEPGPFSYPWAPIFKAPAKRSHYCVHPTIPTTLRLDRARCPGDPRIMEIHVPQKKDRVSGCASPLHRSPHPWMWDNTSGPQPCFPNAWKPDAIDRLPPNAGDRGRTN